MSIQDDIFDIEDFLERADASEADKFDRIVRYIGRLEEDVEKLQKIYAGLSYLIQAVKDMDDA